MHGGAGARDQKQTAIFYSRATFPRGISNDLYRDAGEAVARLETGIRDILSHSPFIALAVAQLVRRYCKGRHETT